MRLATEWIENNGRNDGLKIAQASGWGTILDVELRSGVMEMGMPAWFYEFALTGGPQDVLRYRVNVEWDHAEVERAALELAKPVAEFIQHNGIDLAKHSIGEVIAGYFEAQRRCEPQIAQQVREYLEAAR